MDRALAAIDAANADDPQRLSVRGVEQPKELAHAALASEWLERLCPGPSEALRLAIRAHHIRRWERPRASYPMDRQGYHRWRKDLQRHHANVAADVLRRGAYTGAEIGRVQALIQKRGLGKDPETQLFEDVLCLVFLETQFEDLMRRIEPEKIPNLIERTLKKMSPEAIALVDQLPLAPGDVARLKEHMPQ